MRCTVTEHSADPAVTQVTSSELPKDIQGQGSVLWGCKAVGPRMRESTDGRLTEPQSPGLCLAVWNLR